MTKTSQQYVKESFELASKHDATFNQTTCKAWFSRVGWDDHVVEDMSDPKGILDGLTKWIKVNTDSSSDFAIRDGDDAA